MGLEALLGPKVAETPAPADRRAHHAAPRAAASRAATSRARAWTKARCTNWRESIKSQGVMQPMLVRPLPGNGRPRFEIIAGERRLRAARLAGLDEVPVLVRDVPDESAAVMSLIENIQREDLNPLEEAQGLQRLIDEFHLTHEQAAQAVGRSRSAASNLLRLLQPGDAGAADADGGRHRHGPCACAAGARPPPSRSCAPTRSSARSCRCATPSGWSRAARRHRTPSGRRAESRDMLRVEERQVDDDIVRWKNRCHDAAQQRRGRDSRCIARLNELNGELDEIAIAVSARLRTTAVNGVLERLQRTETAARALRHTHARVAALRHYSHECNVSSGASWARVLQVSAAGRHCVTTNMEFLTLVKR